jgi:hypothetical protein
MGGEAVQASARPGVADNFFRMDYLAGQVKVVVEAVPGDVRELGADHGQIAPGEDGTKVGHHGEGNWLLRWGRDRSTLVNASVGSVRGWREGHSLRLSLRPGHQYSPIRASSAAVTRCINDEHNKGHE